MEVVVMAWMDLEVVVFKYINQVGCCGFGWVDLGGWGGPRHGTPISGGKGCG